MKHQHQEAVRFVYNIKDYRKQRRIEQQKARRKAERMVLVEQCAVATVAFWILVVFSGVLH